MLFFFCKGLALLINLSNLVLSLNAQSGMQYWTTENGLSSDHIVQILQDQNGYIWIGTRYGLNRFDGYEFKSYYYEPNNLISLTTNRVVDMTQDSSGAIWLA